MMGEVISFKRADADETPAAVLEWAADQFQDLIVFGWATDGVLTARASSGMQDGRDVLWLLENLKHCIINGDFVE